MEKVQIVDKTGNPVLFEAIKSTAYTVPAVETDFPDPVRIYVGTSGNLVVKLLNDEEFTTFVDVRAGEVFFGNVIAIKETTSAANLVIVG